MSLQIIGCLVWDRVELFWENNRLKRVVYFEEGVRSGIEQFWNEHGILIDEGSYIQGKPVGLHRRWNEQGRLIEETFYLDAKRFEFRYWDEEGTLRMETLWPTDVLCVEKCWNVSRDSVIEKEGLWDGNQIIWKDKKSRWISPSCGEPEKVKIESWQDRFPRLFLLSFSWEKHPAALECVASFDIGNAEAIYIYGLGGGASFGQMREWLEENPSRKLIFLEDTPGYIAHFFQESPWIGMLENPQVFLELIDEGRSIEEIADTYPVQNIKSISLPSRKGDLFSMYELRLLRQNTLTFALHQDRLHGYHSFSHFMRNIVRVSSSFYANAMARKFEGMPAIICGAGPSLQEAIPWLKEMSSRALIIAGGSTLAALSSQGVPIHFGMAIDPNLEEYRRLKNSFAFDTPLLFSTRVHPGAFQTCNGPFGYMRSGIGGVLEIWMEEELGLTGPLIGADLSSEALSVTTICVAWAQFLGCKTIILSGVDLAYRGRKRYAEGVGDVGDVSFEEETSSPDRIVERKDHEGKPIHTAIRWVMEGSSLALFAEAHPEITFCNTTKQGLPIEGMAYQTREEISQNYLQNIWDVEGKVKEAVSQAKMPHQSAEIVRERLKELQESLARVIVCLEILAGEKRGSTALAEIEIQEELAHDLLFYDVVHTLSREKEGSSDLWTRWLSLARRYEKVLPSLTLRDVNNPIYEELNTDQTEKHPS